MVKLERMNPGTPSNCDRIELLPEHFSLDGVFDLLDDIRDGCRWHVSRSKEVSLFDLRE